MVSKKRTTDWKHFFLAYFEAQYELIQRFKPEIIGHFDLCRLYDPNLRFADFPVVQKIGSFTVGIFGSFFTHF